MHLLYLCEQKMPEAGVSDAEAAAEDAKVLASRRKASMMQVDTTTTTVDGVLRTALERFCMDILQKHFEEDGDGDDDDDVPEAEQSEVRVALRRRSDWVVTRARAAFDSAARGVSDCVQALSDAEAEASRKALKTQSNWFKLKLEVARTAAGVELKNQAVEQQAAYHRQLEARLGEISQGGDALLREANEQLERAHEKIDGLERRASQLDEAYGMSQQLLAKSERGARAARRSARARSRPTPTRHASPSPTPSTRCSSARRRARWRPTSARCLATIAAWASGCAG